MLILEFLKAVLYGIVEGITEWLPVSSTGHLILLDEWLPFAFSKDATFMAEFWEMFEVVIQLGAICAVILLFWKTIWPFGKSKSDTEKKRTFTLWGKVLVASVPAAVAGILFDKLLEKLTNKDIDGWLYNAWVVAAALIVYGVAFILVEYVNRNRTPRITSTDDISYGTALKIGMFQMLSIVPGPSRSGSTILGSIMLGVSRTAAAEFSFLMAIPVMVGASAIKVLGFWKYVMESNVSVPWEAWVLLAVGCLVSFLVSCAIIKFLMDFVKRHSFSSFGIYRIALGVVVLIYFAVRMSIVG